MKTHYLEDLERGIARGCQTPGCKHDKHGPVTTLFLHSNCHPNAGVEVHFATGSGVICIICHQCQRPIVNIGVATDPAGRN